MIRWTEKWLPEARDDMKKLGEPRKSHVYKAIKKSGPIRCPRVRAVMENRWETDLAITLQAFLKSNYAKMGYGSPIAWNGYSIKC